MARRQGRNGSTGHSFRQRSKIGVERARWREAYHTVLGLGWAQFLGLVLALYLGINGIFALLYASVPGCVANTRPGNLSDAFFFSVETLASLGYGYFYPATLFGHVVAACESLLGLIAVAMMTGLIFVRFSRPHARIIFTRNAVIAPFNGVPTLMIRAANERHNLLLEANVWVTINSSATTLEGDAFRRLIDLKLVRDRNPTFTLTWTIMHPIDAASPLYGLTAEQLQERGDVLVVSIAGIDETLNDTVHARHEYSAHDIVFQHRFADVIAVDAERLTVDLTRFHEIHPLAPAATAAGAPGASATTAAPAAAAGAAATATQPAA
jgi:inward rectifier potassium channel